MLVNQGIVCGPWHPLLATSIIRCPALTKWPLSAPSAMKLHSLQTMDGRCDGWLGVAVTSCLPEPAVDKP